MKKQNDFSGEVLFETPQQTSPLNFAARGLNGEIVEFRSDASTSVHEVSGILKAWKAMEDTVSDISDPATQAEEQLRLPARQLAYPYHNVTSDHIEKQFDVGTVGKMVSHVAGVLMGAEQKGTGSPD